MCQVILLLQNILHMTLRLSLQTYDLLDCRSKTVARHLWRELLVRNAIAQPPAMDAGYDEVLSENEFLRELRQQHEATLQRVIQEGWVICVPCSGSFAVDYKFQEDDINAHILIPRQDPSTAQFDTLNGREVLFENKILTVKRDDGEQHASRLLFEEIFYDKDLCKYCVW